MPFGARASVSHNVEHSKYCAIDLPSTKEKHVSYLRASCSHWFSDLKTSATSFQPGAVNPVTLELGNLGLIIVGTKLTANAVTNTARATVHNAIVRCKLARSYQRHRIRSHRQWCFSGHPGSFNPKVFHKDLGFPTSTTGYGGSSRCSFLVCSSIRHPLDVVRVGAWNSYGATLDCSTSSRLLERHLRSRVVLGSPFTCSHHLNGVQSGCSSDSWSADIFTVKYTVS